MSLENDRPESFLGLMMGLEGVADAVTIIHGPTGCKYYPASVSEYGFRDRGEGPGAKSVFRWGDVYFFRQPRLPCTYLDMGKFVTGAGDRLKDAYSRVAAMKPGMIGIVNSPGASLIGEDLTAVGSDVPTVRVDHARYSGTAADGFQDAVEAITRTIVPEDRDEKRGVNLVGLSMLHLNWQDTAQDLSDLLALCGIEVRGIVGAGWTTEDIRSSADAEFNVLVCPEWGERIAEDYQQRFSVPYIGCPEGAPIGFDALESWVLMVCQRMNADPSPAMARIRAGRRRAAGALSVMERYHSLPRGRTFSMYCDGSTTYSLSRFLYDYLGMVPVAFASSNGEPYRQRALKYFDSKGIPVSDDAENTPADVVIASGGIGASLVSRGVALGSVDVEGPGSRFIDVNPAPALGLGGTMRIIDGILNIVGDRQRFRRPHINVPGHAPSMTILSDRDILAAMKEGTLKIENYSERGLTPNGYDLRVAEVMVDGKSQTEGTVKVPPKTSFFVSTVERVGLPDDVCGNLWMRTSWIRKGVITAFGMVDAGFEGTLTLGSYNASDSPVEIPIGERYCQIVFDRMSSPSEKSYAKRSGNYQGQTGVTLNPKR